MKSPLIAIIGSGPTGLESAALLSQAGFAVTVFERGECGNNVRRWGHVRLFSPWDMNTSPWGRALISSTPSSAAAGFANPPAILSGCEFREAYLLPLRQALAERVRFVEQTAVMSIGREQLLKGDAIGKPARAQDRFRLLVADARGERIETADIVLDCSGTYGCHRWLGAGGIPCPGERELLTPENYLLPDVLGRDREKFAGRTSLVVGAGYSAATTIVSLARLSQDCAETKAIWVTRDSSSAPLSPIDNDQLPERAQLVERANELALRGAGPVSWFSGYGADRIRRSESPTLKLIVTLTGVDRRAQEIVVDEVVAHVGYRPDRALTEELQIHECYASQGPIKLAASLLGQASADCLQQSRQGIDVLRNPEPWLFILGAKSYGRDSRFLLQIGMQQAEAVARELCREFQRPFPAQSSS